jgi:hypothetical protein
LRKAKLAETENRELLSKIKSLDGKKNLFDKYKVVWDEELNEQIKSLDGIEITSLKEEIENLAKANELTDVEVNISPSFILSDVFSKKIINVYEADVTINFNTIFDTAVYKFINELSENIQYYISFQIVTLERVKKDIENDFAKLSDLKITPFIITGKIVINVYGLKVK